MNNIKKVCCVDIGIKNLIFCIYDNNNLIQNIKFCIDIDRNVNFEEFEFNLYNKIKLIYNKIIIDYNPDLFLIEKQIKIASNNILLEHMISILCFENNKPTKLINANSKYNDIKKEFNIKKINKKELINYINIELNKCITFKMCKNNELNNIKTNIKKLDDFIDCYLIYDYYKKLMNPVNL